MKIYKDGLPQYVLFRALHIDSSGNQTIMAGTTEGEELSGAILVWSEYKKQDVSIELSTIIWNSFTGMWKAIIPASYITQRGSAWLNITATDMIPVAIEVEVVSRMAYKKIVPPGSYELDADLKHITLKNEYAGIEVEQVLSIFNLSKQIEIYNSQKPKKHSLFISSSERTQDFDIDIAGGILTYVEMAGMDNTDKLQIVVNSE